MEIPNRRRGIAAIIVLCAWALLLQVTTALGEAGYFGTAQINITPELPIRLSGYAGRSTESTVVAEDLYATAAVFGNGADTSILIAVDCTGMPSNVADVVSVSLSQQLAIPRERISITATHTHNGPCIDGYAVNLFGAPLPADQQQRVDQYTQFLTDRLEQVALDAIAHSESGHSLSWGQGSVGFGVNRRGAGIVDHDLPVMRVADASGNTKAIITSYASHAVTLSDNTVSGDWPGYAREAIKMLYPGATALVMIGAAADTDPGERGSVSAAQSQGQSVANEVARLIDGNLMTPVGSTIAAAHGEIALPFATALEPGDPSNARLAQRGTPDLQYGVSTWTFGDEVAMVFLEGEVVVDYSLRLKSEYGDGRMWINAYSNDVPGYIPSERILYEGGYEADSSGYYYALPGRFAHGLEDKIVGEVLRQLDPFFNPLDRLKLVVDRANGSVTILNAFAEPIELDAYTIESKEGYLNGPWNSLEQQGVLGWDEADNASPSRLTEFNPYGAMAIPSGGSYSLGNPLTGPIPSRLGEEVTDIDLTFHYNTTDAGVIRGHVEFVGDDGLNNNLVLTVDPNTGQAAIQNQSPFYDAEIEGYTITSSSGRLLTSDAHWNSFSDQGIAGWDEADNSDAFRVTEFNPTAHSLLGVGSVAVFLGELLDVSGDGPLTDDLEFSFLLTSGTTLRGIVSFGALPSGPLAGDYDHNGILDTADYHVWKNAFGQSVVPGHGADGSGNGIVDAADFTIWRDNLDGASNLAAQRVPEPRSTEIVLCLAALVPWMRPLLGRRLGL